ncbi:MAG: hypothetical protein WCF84_04400 [Anaerolineae bacterium]
MIAYGYFDRPEQTVPAYDPGLEVDCPICRFPLSHPVKSISLLAVGDSRSFFYRVHKYCWEPLSPEQQTAIDSQIVDVVAIAKDGTLN